MNQKVILNGGDGAWAFQDLAESLADCFQVKISDLPRDFNYVLSWNEANVRAISSTSYTSVSKMFIFGQSIQIINDN